MTADRKAECNCTLLLGFVERHRVNAILERCLSFELRYKRWDTKYESHVLSCDLPNQNVQRLETAKTTTGTVGGFELLFSLIIQITKTVERGVASLSFVFVVVYYMWSHGSR